MAKKVWLVIKDVPYESVTDPIQGVYEDEESANCHKYTLEANEKGDAKYYVQAEDVKSWEGVG